LKRKRRKKIKMGRFSRRAIKILFITLLISSCSDTKDNDSWYGTLKIPKVQELRWSDGGLPQKLDPASAVAPPDTDAVRALYEGLTDYALGI
jgi:ABC-type oligopeptide transport system substrate-binding subunit